MVQMKIKISALLSALGSKGTDGTFPVFVTVRH
jgi:hypothetical protein